MCSCCSSLVANGRPSNTSKSFINLAKYPATCPCRPLFAQSAPLDILRHFCQSSSEVFYDSLIFFLYVPYALNVEPLQICGTLRHALDHRPCRLILVQVRILYALPSRLLQQLRPRDRPFAQLGEVLSAGIRHIADGRSGRTVLQVDQLHPVLILPHHRRRFVPRLRQPIEIQLQVHQRRIGASHQCLPAVQPSLQRLELVTVVVEHKRHARFIHLRAPPVEGAGGLLKPCRGSPLVLRNHRAHHVLQPQVLGIVDLSREPRIVEVRRHQSQPRVVANFLQLRRRMVVHHRIQLNLRKSNLLDRLQNRRQVRSRLPPDHKQLHSIVQLARVLACKRIAWKADHTARSHRGRTKKITASRHRFHVHLSCTKASLRERSPSARRVRTSIP